MSTYALIGDSHAQAVFPRLKKLLTPLGHEVLISKPRAGWTTKKHLNPTDGSTSLASLLGEARADVVVFSLGGNNHSLKESYLEPIKEAVQIAKDSGAKRIFWVGPAVALRDDVEKRHFWTTGFLKHHLPSMDVEFIDAREFTQTGHRDDKVHFTRSQYDIWTQKVFEALQKQPVSLFKRSLPWVLGSISIAIPLATSIVSSL